MKNIKFRYFPMKLLVFLTFIFINISFAGLCQNSGNTNFEAAKNLEIFSTLFKELNVNYVDEIKPAELIQDGIDNMLESLDPYTNYIPESEIEDYEFMTTGQYGGIGALIHKNGDYVVISEPYENFPAAKAGLIPGDKILEINGKSAKGKSVNDVSDILKGQPGTTCTLKIERFGQKQSIEKTVIRQKITIDNIPYFGMLNDKVGYIRLSGFTQDASKEVKNAFLRFKESNQLKGIILDLRGNGGGLMNEAINIVNLFVEKGEVVVSTKGKLEDKNKTYRTMIPPLDKDIPLIVLVNQGSASASEIVAGAIQDLDRGVIVGQRTFGKGLVQNVVPLCYNTRLKVTVAKYYIPSDRCIQAIDYSHKNGNGNFERIPDSLIRAFKTKKGRTVYDGGGIDPDIKLEPNQYSNISFSLTNKFLIFDFATKFYYENPTIPSAKDFEINDSIFNDFVSYISDKDYDYTTKSEEELDKWKKTAEKENYFDEIKPEFEILRTKMMHNKKDDLIKYKSEIETLLKAEITTRYYFQKGRIQSTLATDNEIQKAIEVIENQQVYNSILNGTLQKTDNQK